MTLITIIKNLIRFIRAIRGSDGYIGTMADNLNRFSLGVPCGTPVIPE